MIGIILDEFLELGFSRDDIQALRSAYNCLFSDSGTLSERFNEMAKRFGGIGPVDDLIAFNNPGD